jgi:radical SAM protein with 4Fe4S-binding SPASM domain
MKKDIYKILSKEVSSRIKEYRKKWDQAGRGKIELDFPLHLNFELKIGCNLKCPSCLCSLPFKDWPYEVDIKKEIKFDKFCKVIDEGARYGLPSIELNGVNEPFLYNKIVKCIEYASKKGILQISLHTNALLLTEKLSRQLIKSGLTNISFSLDAFYKDTYDKIRVGGNYDKVMNNIDSFLRIKKEMNSGLPLTRVSMTRNKINFNEINKFEEYWENKVDIVSTSFFYNPFVGNDKYEQIDKMYRLEKREDYICYQPYQRLFIFNNGNVAPCCSMFGGNLIIGNINDSSIYSMWNNNKIKKLRQNIKNGKSLPESCKKCKVGIFGKNV